MVLALLKLAKAPPCVTFPSAPCGARPADLTGATLWGVVALFSSPPRPKLGVNLEIGGLLSSFSLFSPELLLMFVLDEDLRMPLEN